MYLIVNFEQVNAGWAMLRWITLTLSSILLKETTTKIIC